MPSWGRDCAAGGRAQSFEAKFVLVDQATVVAWSTNSSTRQHRTTSSTKESCYRQTGGESSRSWELAATSWHLQPNYSAWHPESFCGVSRNQLTSTVSGENPGSRPRWSMHTSWTTPQSVNRALLFLDNSGLSWTVSAPDKVTAVPVRRNGNFQTPISIPVVRPKRCHTLSNAAHRQDYMVACLNYTLQTMMLSPG